MRKEVICIQVDSSEIGLLFWEHLLRDHSKGDGVFDQSYSSSGCSSTCGNMFVEREDTSVLVPRTLFIDVGKFELKKSTVSDRVGDELIGIFNSNNLDETFISCDSSDGLSKLNVHSFSQGRFHCKSLLNRSMERIRQMVDECDHLKMFILVSSIGKSGLSGFLHTLLEELNNEYTTIFKSVFVIIPEESGGEIQSLNSMLTFQCLSKYCNSCIVLEKEQMKRLCEAELEDSSNDALNEISSHVMAISTLSNRFNGMVGHGGLDSMTGYGEPLHFSFPLYGQLYPFSKTTPYIFGTSDISRIAFKTPLIECSFENSYFYESLFIYRGNIQLRDIVSQIQKRKEQFKFVENPHVTCFDIRTIQSRHSNLSRFSLDCAIICHSSDIEPCLKKIKERGELALSFDLGNICNGMERDEFSDMTQDIDTIIDLYSELKTLIDTQGPDDE